MTTVLFSGVGTETLVVVLVALSIVHIVLDAIFTPVAIAIAQIWIKKELSYWPVFLSAFLLGEIVLLPILGDHIGFIDTLGYSYPLAMIVGYACGILASFGLSKNKNAGTGKMN
jgi:hypothetical protein